MTLAFGKYSTNVERMFDSSSSLPQLNRGNGSLYADASRDYADIAERKKSFILWPQWASVGSDALAAAGFHYTGDSDKVRCHACHMERGEWTRLDDPLDMHLRQLPVCMLARGISAAYASQSNVGRPRRTGRHGNDNTWSSLPDPRERALRSPSPDAADPVIVPRDALRRPSHNPANDLHLLDDETQRFKSFSNKWSEDYPVQPKDLAKAGLFFKGPGDKVQCAFCKGVMHKWASGDSALGEHARNFPDCPFVAKVSSKCTPLLQLPAAQVMLNMGYDEKQVVEVVMRLNQQGVESPTTNQMVDALFDLEDEDVTELNKSREAAAAEADLLQGIPSELVDLKKENAELRHSTVCKVCLVNKVETLLLPCRHLVSCSECSGQVDFCPLCRVKIVGTVKTYMA